MNVLTPEAPTSTWSQDCHRGHAHPDSVAARQQRIAQAAIERAGRSAKFNQVMTLLRETVRTEQELLATLHTLASTLAQHHGSSSYLHHAIEALDELADSIEYPEDAQ